MATQEEIRLFYSFAERYMCLSDYDEYLRGVKQENRKNSVSYFLSFKKASSFIIAAFDWHSQYKSIVGWGVIHKQWLNELYRYKEGSSIIESKSKCVSIW